MVTYIVWKNSTNFWEIQWTFQYWKTVNFDGWMEAEMSQRGKMVLVLLFFWKTKLPALHHILSPPEQFHLHHFFLYFVLLLIIQKQPAWGRSRWPWKQKSDCANFISKTEYQLANLLSKQGANNSKLSYDIVAAYFIRHGSSGRSLSWKSCRTRNSLHNSDSSFIDLCFDGVATDSLVHHLKKRKVRYVN